MTKYIKYFFYVMKHKALVFNECRKKGMIWRGLTHDNSKFRPFIFISYARYFHTPKLKMTRDIEIKFERAWRQHYSLESHHWEHWVNGNKCFPMPWDDIDEMICDITAMSIVFGDTPQKYYINNINKFQLSQKSRLYFEKELGLIPYDSSRCVTDLCKIEGIEPSQYKRNKSMKSETEEV